MNRRQLTRVQLIVLAVLAFLLLGRGLVGSERPGTPVAFSDIEPHQLKEAAFVLEQPTRAVVEATGSFAYPPGESAGRPELTAYGWIWGQTADRPVWVMRPEAAQHGRGSLAYAQDTLQLEAGSYRAYFSTYGNELQARRGGLFRRLFNPDRHWQNDHRKWSLSLRALGDGAAHLRLLDEDEAAATAGERRLWSSAPIGSDQRESYLFDVRRPLQLHIHAVGEFEGEEPLDYGWIENVMTDERVWTMTRANTEPAGGAPENRSFRGSVLLPPGLYRAVFQTDAGHAYDDWYGNPPLSPAAWGLTLVAEPGAARDVAPFDPWQNRQPLVDITRMSNDQLRSAQLAVERPIDVMVYATGELSRSSSYDYAWIENNDTEAKVWEMRRENSQPAGGDRNNRVEAAFLHLTPGTYTVYYQTDDSHAYDDWNNGTPDHPERWGVTIFPVDPGAAGAVELLRQTETSGTPVPQGEPPPPLPPPGPGAMLVQQVRLGNDVHMEQSFELDEPTRLQIHAVGEIKQGDRYDYGWIERADTDETVWEMTWQNTQPAGGDERNRRFADVVSLPPGRYRVHFETDHSHAYGDFGDYAPQDPERWGIMIARVP